MNTTAGAAFSELKAWQAIDWRAVQENVRRLQARIVKATREGRWGKVQALQHLLTHSFSGKVLAVRRVTENAGHKTPGVDKVLWNTPEKKTAGVDQLQRRGYQPQPLRRVYIPKSNGKKRPLGIPTMRDRAMQALYLLALDPVAETTADPNSYGFRKARSCADAVEQCFKVLSPKHAARYILEGDIKSCFDRISHAWLLTHVPMDKGILHKWLKAGYLEKHVLHPTEAGTPQGGIISAALANLTLNGLEPQLREHFPRRKEGKGRKEGKEAGCGTKVNLVRYADDFIISGHTTELLEQKVKPLVQEFLAPRGLELSLEKTTITALEDGFDFLGFEVRLHRGSGSKDKLLIQPAKSSIAHFLTKIRQVVKENATASAGNLIRRLNPLLQGWTQYYRHVVSQRTFSQVQHAIFQCLWRWAKRRHPRRGGQWVKAHYFGSQGGQNWSFYGRLPEADGSTRIIHLSSPAHTPIRRHVKIRGEANPYDPQWEVYFETRLGLHMQDKLRGRRQLRYLWLRQDGICPACGQKITPETGWHNHHVKYRVHGGADSADNRQLYHPECHRQLHYQASTPSRNRVLPGGVGKA
jgi:RNA-directed DNA polymerase